MRVTMSCFLALLCLSSLSSLPLTATESGGHNHSETDILLPLERADARVRLIAPTAAPTAQEWRQFMQRHGSWSVTLDPATFNPRQAIGAPVQIDGFSAVNKDNVRAAAERFINDHASLFNLAAEQMDFVRATPVAGAKTTKWYVSFKQQYKGIDVLYSEAELRINDRAEVFAFRFNTWPDLQLDPVASLSATEAGNAAVRGLSAANKEGLVYAADPESIELNILPLINSVTTEYRLVYSMTISSNHPGHRFDALVDAQSGEVLRRVSRCLHVASTVSVDADVRTGLSTGPIETVPLQNLNVNIGGSTYTTDVNGNIDVDIDDVSAVELSLAGPYARVEAHGRDNASVSEVLIPGQDGTVSLNNDNSHLFERNLFYHANVIRNWHKNTDPSSTAMDIPMVLHLWYEGGPFGGGDQEPNAFSNRDTIMFLGLSDQTMVMADGGSVLYHEYGHSINNLFAESLGGTFNNATAQEGIADVVAAMLEDHPRVGLGVFVNEPDRSIRNADNTLRYPDDVQGESHADGQIISGAFWDLRKLTDNETTTRLLHFARYGLPDDQQDGMVFGEWFLEVLTADDDDGNLNNGTPHCDEIIAAFNKHGIGPELFLQTSFTHAPLPDTDDTENSYPLQFNFSTIGLKGGVEQRAIVEYWTNRNPQRMSVEALADDAEGFSALIPAQPAGTMVSYSIYRLGAEGEDNTLLSGSGAVEGVYRFLVGYKIIAVEDFEDTPAWQLSSPDDRSFGANWEIADPDRVYLPDMQIPVDLLVQPGDDHSEPGVQCLVTGAQFPQFDFSEAMVGGGTATATSTAYDLGQLQFPVIDCYYFFSALSFAGDASGTHLRIDISEDLSGWTTLATMTETTTEWSRVLVAVPEELHGSRSVYFRFVVNTSTDGFGSLASGMIDDLRILAVQESTGTDVNETEAAAANMTIAPNPARENCAITFDLEHPATVSAQVSDLTGNTVFRWTESRLSAGTHTLNWNLQSDVASRVAAGVYFVRVNIDGKLMTGSLQIR